MAVTCRRRRLAAVGGGCVLVVVALVSLLRQTALRSHSLEEQLESSVWRDTAASEDDPDAHVVNLRRMKIPRETVPCTRYMEFGIIFTKADQHERMRPNLRRTWATAAAHTSACIRFHMFTDNASRPVIAEVFHAAAPEPQFKVVYHDIAPMADQTRELIELMQRHFAPRTGTYYNDVLFFLTTTLHRTLPAVARLVMVDIDILVKDDLSRLEQHFARFDADQVMGLSQELSPVYRHVLEAFRARQPATRAGGPPPHGFPGFNSGVVLLDLEKMRQSKRYNQLITREVIEARVAQYSFKGHLGDQDLYTLLALDDPQLFYTLPCGWNRQLCLFWKDQLPEVFDQYFQCPGTVHILHGNCRTPIPSD